MSLNCLTFRTQSRVKVELPHICVGFFDASLPKSGEDLFLHVLDNVRAEGSVLCAVLYEHCDIIKTRARQQDEDIRKVISEALNHLWSLPLVRCQ